MSATACSANGKRIGSISFTAIGFPGRLAIRVFPLTPAVPRDRAARGWTVWDSARLQKDMSPSQERSSMADVASGVTSRGENPVPPVVMMISTALADDDHSVSMDWMASISSGTMADWIDS